MKRFIPFAAVLLMMAALSCQQEFIPGEGGSQDKYTLNFVCDGLQTKSEESVGLPEERVLNSIDVYFYRDGATSSDAVFHKRLDLQDCYNSYNAHIDFLASEVSNLFLSSATCEVFAIANVPASLVPGNVSDDLTGSSMPELMTLKVESTFGSAAGADHIPSSFVMTGYNTITLTSRAKATVATGTVPLYRLAAKLELLVHVQDSVHLRTTYKDEFNHEYIAEEIWRPMTNKPGAIAQVEAYLENGYKEAALGVQQDPANHMVQISTTTPMTAALLEMFFKYSKNKMPYDDQTTVTITEPKRWTYSDFQAGLCAENEVGCEASGQTVNTVYMYSDPSYTYPITWSRGVEKEPFFKLCLPWSRDGVLLVYKNGLNNPPVEVAYNTAQKQYYYKVIFPVHTLESNNFYRLKMNVAILGSETDDALVELVPTYAVAGWQNKTEILEEAEVGNARFLSVAQSEYTLYNETTLAIPFVSSDDCIISSATWTQATKNGSNSGNAASWFTIDGRTVRMTHTLNNAAGATQDVRPYEITLTICHSDEPSFNKTITITQYPAIYIKAFKGGYAFIDGYYRRVVGSEAPEPGGTRETNVTENGVTLGAYYHTYPAGNRNTPYGNNLTSTENNTTGQGTYSAPSSQLDMTAIYVTAFTSADNYFTYTLNGTHRYDYIIGDPRIPWGSDTLIDYLASDGTTKSWDSYYSMLQKGTDQYNIIAPAFLLASEWGRQGQGNSDLETVTKRCATYQEAGYPAGRWRLPTMAEVMFCINLQRNNFIGELFKNTANNWVSNGLVVQGNGTVAEGGGQTVRCVYDIWYWGEEPVDGFDRNKQKYVIGL